MTDYDLDDLAAKAAAATPGPWASAPPNGWSIYRPDVDSGADEPVLTFHDAHDDQHRLDVHFIAAANPEVVAALVERTRTAEAEVARLRAEMESAGRGAALLPIIGAAINAAAGGVDPAEVYVAAVEALASAGFTGGVSPNPEPELVSEPETRIWQGGTDRILAAAASDIVRWINANGGKARFTDDPWQLPIPYNKHGQGIIITGSDGDRVMAPGDEAVMGDAVFRPGPGKPGLREFTVRRPSPVPSEAAE